MSFYLFMGKKWLAVARNDGSDKEHCIPPFYFRMFSGAGKQHVQVSIHVPNAQTCEATVCAIETYNL